MHRVHNDRNLDRHVHIVLMNEHLNPMKQSNERCKSKLRMVNSKCALPILTKNKQRKLRFSFDRRVLVEENFSYKLSSIRFHRCSHVEMIREDSNRFPTVDRHHRVVL